MIFQFHLIHLFRNVIPQSRCHHHGPPLVLEEVCFVSRDWKLADGGWRWAILRHGASLCCQLLVGVFTAVPKGSWGDGFNCVFPFIDATLLRSRDASNKEKGIDLGLELLVST